jgi:hypothetical protein
MVLCIIIKVLSLYFFRLLVSLSFFILKRRRNAFRQAKVILEELAAMMASASPNMQHAVSAGDRLCGRVATDPEARVRFPALPEKK